jgi:hypothetical protein
MKKSLRLLVATAVMAAAVTFAATTDANSLFASGAEPIQCPPGGCAVSAAAMSNTPNSGAEPIQCPPGGCAVN